MLSSISFKVKYITCFRQFHATKLKWSNDLFHHISIIINKYCRKIAVRPVRNTSGRDAFQKFGDRKFSCQTGKILID